MNIPLSGTKRLIFIFSKKTASYSDLKGEFVCKINTDKKGKGAGRFCTCGHVLLFDLLGVGFRQKGLDVGAARHILAAHSRLDTLYSWEKFSNCFQKVYHCL
jgi:hypothetical protein